MKNQFRLWVGIWLASFACHYSIAEVKVWEEPLVLPSYRLKEPDPNPMFYRNESYQGAQKRIYPYPLMDGITGDRRPESYQALYLENEYLKVCILPEIGGRLFYATDKSNGYEIFYRQHVIKPALIGMLGAWISGGIEWCVFHHHRNTTHMPVQYSTSSNPDGSKTIWIGETERRHRMRWIIGITLHPGRSYLEVQVRMINRTELPHSILYWANVAVHVNDSYQVIFPPSVQVATYHAKNDFVHWPIGQGMYRGSNYDGVDLRWWKNHPRPVSCFAWDLQEDFMGGYDHERQAGVVHIGNHHVVCGAKLWEWAPGNVWDTQVLTDEDGPYAELMVGAFSDNQPDYSWIKPGEVKRFTQYWYPIQEIGGVKHANLNGAVNLELTNGVARVGLHVTSPQEGALVKLTGRGREPSSNGRRLWSFTGKWPRRNTRGIGGNPVFFKPWPGAIWGTGRKPMKSAGTSFPMLRNAWNAAVGLLTFLPSSENRRLVRPSGLRHITCWDWDCFFRKKRRKRLTSSNRPAITTKAMFGRATICRACGEFRV